MRVTILTALFFATIFATSVASQSKQTPLDSYIDAAMAIVIVKCVEVGPVNILLQANVEVEVLLTVAGSEPLPEITLRSQYGMQPGKRYLLRLEQEIGPNGRYFTRGRDSVIEVSNTEDIAILRTLSPRIVVLRTINMRVDSLESKVRSLTYEMDQLKALRKGN